MAKKRGPKPEVVPTLSRYTIIRDSREKSGYWHFNESTSCTGTVEGTLKTGDYCIEGFEDIFTIERKASTGELSGNITQKRFENELKRMDKLKHAYIICEFTLDDVLRFPYNSTIPSYVWPKLRVTSSYILKRIVEIETTYNVHFVFAGNNSKEVAKAIFRRMAEMYAERLAEETA